MLKQERSNQLFEKAQGFIPGGVNSPVRAFKAVGGKPLFMERAKGAYLYDVDGNHYIDMINSWGPMILGHANEKVEQAIRDAIPQSLSFGAPTGREVEMAELITSLVPGVEKVRMVNSGTEATMSAVRLARGFTGRDKMIKLEGCYHGHGDSFLIAAGSGALTMGTPDSPGVTKGTAQDTLIAPYNNLQAIEELVASNKEQIAALILEPVVGNMGCIAPQEGYLEGLRKICDREGILLIFDEVMTGFRLAKGGAQERFGVRADLVTLGKIIGGGMPVGAYGGRREIMNFVSPSGPVYQAGTLSGNPIAMAAGLAMLHHLNDHPEVYQQLEASSNRIVSDLRDVLQQLDLRYTINQVGSMYSLFFTEAEVVDYDSAKTCDTALFGRYFRHMLEQGVYLAPSQFETLFVSAALGEQEFKHLKQASLESLKAVMQQSE